MKPIYFKFCCLLSIIFKMCLMLSQLLKLPKTTLHSIQFNCYQLSHFLFWFMTTKLIGLTLKAHSLKEGVKEKGAGINLGNVQVNAACPTPPPTRCVWLLHFFRCHRRSANVSNVVFCRGGRQFSGWSLIFTRTGNSLLHELLKIHSSTNINCPYYMHHIKIYVIVCIHVPPNNSSFLCRCRFDINLS